jgi:hypothetical protein
MKITILPALAATCALTFAAPVLALHGHGSQGHSPKPPAPTHGSSTHATTSHGSASHSSVKPPKHGAGATSASSHKATTKPAKTTASSKTSKTTKTDKTTKTAQDSTKSDKKGTTSATADAGTELSPVQQKLLKNTKLAEKLQARLPEGTDLQKAAEGFRNLGQFVAAVNVSSNLGIPFEKLKAKMTGEDPVSLGQAIKALRPTVDAAAEAAKAQKEASAMTSSTTTSTTTTTTQLTPLQQKLQKKTNLSAKLQSRLPAGMTVQEACVGFRTLGQFVAAVNVSNNLKIPFAQLKAKVTGENSMSLGQAIHALRPAVDAGAEANRAQQQASTMVQ